MSKSILQHSEHELRAILEAQRQYFVDKYGSPGSLLSNNEYWTVLRDIKAVNLKTEAAVQEIVERCLPNSQNGTGRVFINNLTGSAMASGYRQAIDDIRHNLQQAGLLSGDDVTEGGTE